MSGRGTVLAGRYELNEIIGRGGMAEVWRARDTRLGRDVAIKRLRVDLATDPTFQARFRREAQSAANLNHPNIVSVYDTGSEHDEKTDVDVPFIVMELVQGVTLRQVLRDGRKILPERALEFTQGVLEALAYSHRGGIIHRDIKPANVMLTPQGSVKVMDFGIARAVADTSATMTQTAAVIGTAQYLSPEQARGEKVTNKSDIYSAGCLLYELLVGRPPFVGESPVSVAYQHVRETPVPPSELDPEITPAMDAITLKALAKDPADRYQDAKEMADDIRRALGNVPVAAVLPPKPAPTVADSAPTQVMPQSQGARRALTDDTAEMPIEDEERSRTGRIALWVLLISVLIAGGVVAAMFFLQDRTPEKVKDTVVPNLETYSRVQAINELTNRGLGYKLIDIESDQTKDTVVKTNPEGGEKVEKGFEVEVYLSLGPKTSQMPNNLLGMTKAEAVSALVEAGFLETKISIQEDDPRTEATDAKAGTVTSYSPQTSEELIPAETEVTLTIATGKSHVPNLNGLTLNEARQVAKDAGFELSDPTYQETSEYPADKIMNQTPKPNSVESRETPIGITIATAPVVTATPEPSPTPTPSETSEPEPTKTKTSKESSPSPSATKSE